MSKIPKKIHWVWFGDKPLNDKNKACVESWSRVMPDYEIVKWNEDNFDISSSAFASAAYEAGQYAFVSDIARQMILREHGGIYLDADVEALKPLDKFLENDAFMSFKNAHDIFGITSGIIGARPGFDLLTNVVEHMERDGLVKIGDGVYKTVSYVLVDEVKKFGIKIINEKQTSNGLTVYPYEYLCPKVDKQGNVETTENSHLIHYFFWSWVSDKMLAEYMRLSKQNPEMFKQEED